MIESDTFSAIPRFISALTSTNIKLVETSSNKFLNEYPDLMEPKFSTAVVKHGIQHIIPTKNRPVFTQARRLAPDREFLEIRKMGTSRKSRSLWASPLHMVSKRKGGWRPYGDYRKLNDVTAPDRYPIPCNHDLSARLKDKTIFSKIDLVRVYHLVTLEDNPKTAGIVPFGL